MQITKIYAQCTNQDFETTATRMKVSFMRFYETQDLKLQ